MTQYYAGYSIYDAYSYIYPTHQAQGQAQGQAQAPDQTQSQVQA